MRNERKIKSKWIALLLVFTLVFVAGCQAVAGVDFNKMLKNAIKVTSSEGTQTVEFKLDLYEDVLEQLDAEEQELVKLFSSVKLQLDDMKMQDADHVSLNGRLTLGDSKGIGFSMQTSDELAVITLEGAKKPFVLDMSSESLLGMTGVEAAPAAPSVDQATLTQMGYEMLDTVGAYMIDNLPNPERLTVKPAVESINGESVSLMHVHVDLNGKELWALVSKYVDALVADREGLTAMIEGIFDIFEQNQDLWDAFGEVNPFEDPELDAPTIDETKATAADEIAAMLEDLQQEIKSSSEDDPESLTGQFGEGLVIAADLYVDSKLDIRKQQVEVQYTLPDFEELNPTPQELEEQELSEEEGYEDYGYEDEYYSAYPEVKGFSVKFTGEFWNVNGAVKSDVPVAAADAVTEEDLFDMQGYKLLKLFEEDSFAYDLLKNQFELNKQSISWDSYGFGYPAILTPSYITIIPLRDTAYELGAELIYDKKTKSMELFDEATNTTIIFKLDSQTATVNGQAVKLSFPVTAIDGVTYVPARDLAKALKAKISWTEYYEDEKVFMFEREL